MATVDTALLASAKLALRITTDDFDGQITDLLNAAFIDMSIAGVEVPAEYDAIVKQAAITYVLMNFGTPDDYERYKSSYDEQKGQLATATGYTDWSAING